MSTAERFRAPSRGFQLAILAVVAGALLLLWLALGAVGALTAQKPSVERPPPPGTFRPTPEQWGNLTFARIAARDFSAVLVTDGRIATDDEQTTQVFSPYSGRIVRVLAKLGDEVRKGAPLMEVDASEFVQGRADLATAAGQLRLAAAAEARLEGLLKVQGASQKDVQQSQADLTSARAAYAAARERLRILGESPSEIGRLERSADASRSSPTTLVTAPIAGTITQRSVGAGQNLASLVNNGGGVPAFTISDLDWVWVVGNVREEDIGAVHVGDRVTARTPAYPGRIFEGRLAFVAPTVDPNTRRIAVRAVADNRGHLLHPEMFAEVGVTTAAPTPAPAVPASAIIYEGDLARVWIVRPGRTLALRKITPGRAQGGFVEVREGLKVGDEVVDAGAIFIDRAATND